MKQSWPPGFTGVDADSEHGNIIINQQLDALAPPDLHVSAPPTDTLGCECHYQSLFRWGAGAQKASMSFTQLRNNKVKILARAL